MNSSGLNEIMTEGKTIEYLMAVLREPVSNLIAV